MSRRYRPPQPQPPGRSERRDADHATNPSRTPFECGTVAGGNGSQVRRESDRRPPGRRSAPFRPARRHRAWPLPGWSKRLPRGLPLSPPLPAIAEGSAAEVTRSASPTIPSCDLHRRPPRRRARLPGRAAQPSTRSGNHHRFSEARQLGLADAGNIEQILNHGERTVSVPMVDDSGRQHRTHPG